MSVSDDTKLEALLDHYNDTFKYIREYAKIRERLFLFALIVVAIMFFDITAAADSTAVISEIIEKKVGLKIAIKPAFIESILWFSLLSITIRYFQMTVLVQRQYDYMHELEDKLCKLGGNFFYREGKAYKEAYPLFSRWTGFLYTIAFPVILIVVISIKTYNEYLTRNALGINYFINLAFFVMIVLSVLLYWLQIHFKK